MIRKAQMRDLDAYYELICQLENQRFDKERFKEIYKRQLDDPSYSLSVYEINDEVCAIMTLQFYERLHHNGLTCELVELITNVSHRNEGIGEKLLQEAIGQAQQRSCLEIELSSSMWRTDAHRFYERHGFKKNHYNFILSLKQ